MPGRYQTVTIDTWTGKIIETPIKKHLVSVCIEKYIKTCTSTKCLGNQRSEKLYLSIFAKFLADKKIQTIDEVGRDHLEEFEAFLLTKMKASSVNRRMCPIKQLFTKCVSWKLIFENPALGMKIQKEEKNPFKPWSPELMRKFISLTDGIWKKIFTFLWMSGARPMEVKNLRWTDIDYDKGELILRCGKNSRISRTFYMTDDVDKLLHSIKMNGPFVFGLGSRQLSNDNLYQYCKKRMKKLGVVGYTVYGIRHGFATQLSSVGKASAFEVAQAMGHQSLDTTKRYVHVDEISLKEKQKKANRF